MTMQRQTTYAPPVHTPGDPLGDAPAERAALPPPPHARVMGMRDGGPPGLPHGVGTSAPPVTANLVVVTSVSGGIGASVIAALLAEELGRRAYACALVDADFEAGGLDVLLGIECEPGLRFDTIEAPLGRIDGAALNHELPRCGEVRVLAFDAWDGQAPDWWQAQAAVRALCDVNQAVVVDAGRGEAIARIPDLEAGALLVVLELSVLGLARAKAWLARRDHASPLLVGVAPRGGSHRRNAVETAEAEDYLGVPIAFVFEEDRRLQDDVLNGLGVRPSSRRNRETVARICDRLGAASRGPGLEDGAEGLGHGRD